MLSIPFLRSALAWPEKDEWCYPLFLGAAIDVLESETGLQWRRVEATAVDVQVPACNSLREFLPFVDVEAVTLLEERGVGSVDYVELSADSYELRGARELLRLSGVWSKPYLRVTLSAGFTDEADSGGAREAPSDVRLALLKQVEYLSIRMDAARIANRTQGMAGSSTVFEDLTVVGILQDVIDRYRVPLI